MKSLNKSLLISVLMVAVFGLTSCEDMLQEEIYGQVTAEELMQNEDNLILLLAKPYADMKFVHDHWGYWGVNTLTADEGLCPTRAGGDWNDSGYWKNLNTHNWNVYGEAFKSIWNRTSNGAVLCNRLLATFDEASEETKKKDIYAQYVGELEVLRSYYYYMLFDCFGRIPYMENYSDTVMELMAPPVVWAHLVACLERNAPNMQVVDDANRNTLLGRVTQGMAYTLLARLYLNAVSFGCTPENVMAAARPMDSKYGKKGSHPLEEVGITISSNDDFYTNAARCCDKVIESGSYSIEDDYFSNFMIKNEASRENILVIVEDGSKTNEENVDKVKNKLQIYFLTLHYVHQKLWPKLQDKPWNGFCARPDYMNIFNEEDVRGAGEKNGNHNKHRYAWLLGPIYGQKTDTIIVDEGKSCAMDSVVILTQEIKCDTAKYAQTDDNCLSYALRTSGARNIKYEIDTAGVYRYCENDFVLFRYADVILMKKEALVRGGSSENPNNYLTEYEKMKARAFKHSANPAAAYAAAYPDADQVTNDLLGGILAERGRELSWECCRRRDLIRFEQFENIQYVTNKALTRRWFPIPFTVINNSNVREDGTKIWTQNEGY